LPEGRAGASLATGAGRHRPSHLAPLARFVDGVAIAVECVTVSARHHHL